MSNTIEDRVNKGLCPICKKPITKDFQVATHQGKKVWICNTHYADINQDQITKDATVKGVGC